MSSIPWVRGVSAALLCASALVAAAAEPASEAAPAATAGAAAATHQSRAPALVLAAKAGDGATALALIKQGADVKEPESDGTTALHWAVYHNDLPLIEALIRAGARASVANDYGSTPLAEAAVVGSTEVIARLLKAGADPDSANADGQTALMILARTSNVEAAKLLLRAGAKVNATEQWHGQSALMWAAAESQPAMVKLLLEHGALVNARSMRNNWQRLVTAEPRAQMRAVGGLTALLYATRQGCLECVRELLLAHAQVDLPDPEGVTPLLMAITNFHFDLAALLVEKGANVNKWDWWGRTPLYAVVDLNTVPHGGRPDRPSLDQTTSLTLIELLLTAGANPNAQLKLFPPYRAVGPDRGADMMLTIGATPLLRAAKAGDAPAISLLLKHGANPDLANLYGMTPIMAAAGIGSNEIDTRGRFKTQSEAVASIELLVKAGAHVNAHETRLGQTALHGAAFWGWDDVVKCLVAHEADLNAKDSKGMTPLDSALGRAGGHGRGGTSVQVHESTAALIKQLLAANSEDTARRQL